MVFLCAGVTHNGLILIHQSLLRYVTPSDCLAPSSRQTKWGKLWIAWVKNEICHCQLSTHISKNDHLSLLTSVSRWFEICWDVFEIVRIIWDVSGGSLKVPKTIFLYVFGFSELSKKCLGGSRRVLGVPRTPLTIINLPENLYIC